MGFSSDQPLVSDQISPYIDLPKEFPEMRNNLILYLKKLADVINKKEGSVYSLAENATFNQYPVTSNPQSTRNVYRKCFDMVDLNGGNIASGATVFFPHNITGIVQGTMITVGCASTTNQFFTVVYPDCYMDATNVYFTNPNPSAVTKATMVCEYMKT